MSELNQDAAQADFNSELRRYLLAAVDQAQADWVKAVAHRQAAERAESDAFRRFQAAQDAVPAEARDNDATAPKPLFPA